MSIKYKSGYKYRLENGYKIDTGIKRRIIVRKNDKSSVQRGVLRTKFLSLHPDGILHILKGYCWDGPSGPTIDTRSFMRGSLVHDALYQLMREDLLERDYRKAADQLLYDVCIEDGMSRFRAWYVHKGVRRGAGKAVLAKSSRPVEEAP